MGAKTLTPDCKGNDCSRGPGALLKTGLCLSSPEGPGEELALHALSCPPGRMTGVEPISVTDTVSSGSFNMLSNEHSVQSPQPCGRRKNKEQHADPFLPGFFYAIEKETQMTQNETESEGSQEP